MAPSRHREHGLTPLLELGIYNLADLVEKTGPAQDGSRDTGTFRLIHSAMLTDLYGTRPPVRDAQRIALNRLSKLLHSDNEGADHSKYWAPENYQPLNGQYVMNTVN